MKKCAKINLCIIGSTSFGKTSIATSLIKVAATTDGCISLRGAVDKIKEIRNRLDVEGQLAGTSWEDIIKIQFLLRGSNNRSWLCSLHDYPGALFANYVAQQTWRQRIKNLFSKQSQATPNPYNFGNIAAKKAVQLTTKLERADALMVLVPADIADAKYADDRDIYKQKLAEFLEKVLQQKPHIPVCLCINKWDMFDCGIEKLEDKLNEEPFRDFYQSLKFVCGENLSTAAISAFGHHDQQNKEKIDPNQEQKPLNILETLLPLAEKAEKARFERTVDAWKQSNWIKKTLAFPFRTASLLAARYTDKHIRNGLLKMAAKAWGLFAAFVLTVAVILSAATTVAYWAKEEGGFRNLEKNFDDYESKPYLVDVEKLDAAHKNLDASNIVRKMFFNSRIQNLKTRFKNIEGHYNDSVLNEAKAYCDDADNKDIPSWEKGDPEERKNRAERRMERLKKLQPPKEHKEHEKHKILTNRASSQKQELTKPPKKHEEHEEHKILTNRASSQKQELTNLIAKEEKLLQNIKNNFPLYKSAYELFHDTNSKTICRRIRKFIDAQKGGHPECGALFDELEKQLDKTEKSIAEELERKITEYKNSNPPKTAAEQAKLDRMLIALITAYESQFVENSENFKPFVQKRKELSADEGNQNKYGPFDTEYNRLVALDRTGKLREIKKFKDKYSYDKFPKRKEKFDDLDNLSRELLDYIAGEVKKAETDNRDNDKLFAQQRIDLATALKNKYEWAAGEYIQDSDEQRDVLRKKSEKQRLIADLQKYILFDKEYSKPDQNNLRAIAAFLGKFTTDAYPRPEYVKKIKELERVKDVCKKEIEKQREAQLEKNGDNEDAAATERIKLCQARIDALTGALGKFVNGSDEARETERQLAEQKAFMEKLQGYKSFEDKVKALLESGEKGKLRRIDVFLHEHSKEHYPDTYHQRLFKRIEATRTVLFERVGKNLNRTLAQNPVTDTFLPAADIVLRTEKRLRAYEDAKQEYVEGSDDWRNADAGSQQAKSTVDEWTRYIQFEKDYKNAKEASINNRLIKIHEFLNKYDPKTYAMRATLFDELKNDKEETEKQIRLKLKAELKEIKEPTIKDFSNRIGYFEQKAEILGKYRGYYPVSSDQHRDCETQLALAEKEKAKYEKWIELEILIGDIESARNKSNDDPRILMPMVQELERKFPRQNNPSPDLNDLYALIASIKQDAEKKLVDELTEKLKEFPDEGEGQELRDNLKGRINIINDFLRYLKGTSSHSIYRSQCAEYCVRLDEQDKKAVLQDAIAKLRQKLDSSITAREKQQEIDAFMEQHAECEKYFPIDYRGFKSERERLYRIAAWHDLRGEIMRHLEKIPDDHETSKLSVHKSKCEEFRNQLCGYQDEFIKSEVNSIREKLEERIKSIEEKIGDGTYPDIEKKAKEYKKEPSKENFEKLRDAIAAFNTKKPENQTKKEDVETIKKKSEKDWSARNRIIDSWSALSACPTRDNWLKYESACMDFWISDNYGNRLSNARAQEYSDVSDLDKYREYYNFINSSNFIGVEFTGFDYLGKLGELWCGGVKRVRFYDNRQIAAGKTNGTMWFDIKTKNENNYWYKGQSDVDHQGNSNTLEHRINISVNSTLKFRIYSIGNVSGERPSNYDDFEIDPIKILVPLVTKKSYQEDFKGPRGVLIRLVFSK